MGKGGGAMKPMENEGFRSGVRGLRIVSILVGALAIGPLLLAQSAGPDNGPGAGTYSGPGTGPSAGLGARAVRLSYVDGQVQLSMGNTVLASRALANTPLFEGTQITTSDDGRAEVQFEDGSVARVSPNSTLTLAVLRQQGDATETQLVLDSGLGYFEFQGDTPTDHMQIRFGGAAVVTSGFSVLRVDLDEPPGEIAVFSGNARVEGAGNLSMDLHGGENAKLNAADPGDYTLAETIEPDSWDAWNSDRDQALTSEEAERTQATASEPNSNNPAWSDLDANGNWYNVPGQGYVWSPYDAMNSGWEPYGCGNWVFSPGYGYTWVSCEPWGYMPYESGMWNYYDGFGWGWVPGGFPWWSGGGWRFNVGSAPFRYRPPLRPRGGPVHPGQPIRPGGRYQPYPVLAVNRIKDGTYGQPVRIKGSPVTIAGNNVQPLRPLSPRPVYANGYVSNSYRPGTNPGQTGMARYGFVQSPSNVTRPAYGQTYGTYARPSGGPARAPSYYGGYTSGYTSPSRGSVGSSAGRSYGGNAGGGSAPRAGGGGVSHGGGFSGGGGGAAHASGGGGGGGASHGGGGGGGGSHH